MKILVTGGAGYIGTHTCVELIEAGYEVAVCDNYCNSVPEALDRVRRLTGADIAEYNIDIRDKEALRGVFADARPDAVIHFAAFKSAPESVGAPLKYYSNLAGNINLISAMDEAGVRKLVYSSSACVYGETETMPLREDGPTGAINPYGYVKLSTERIIKDLCAAEPEWSAVMLRYFNPVGAHPSGLIGEDPSGIPGNVAPRILRVIAGRDPYFTVTGADYPTPDGTGIRDYIHIKDLARGHVAALRRCFKKSGELAVNLGTGKGASVYELLHAFERALGREIPTRIVGRRPGDAAESYADPSLAYTELGWRAEKTIDEMCADALRWQTMNPNGYKK